MKARAGEWIALYTISVLVALVLSGVLVEVSGGDWWPVLEALVDGSVRGPQRWGQTLGIAAPMLLVGLGTIVSSRAGLVNIGQEGQLLFGTAVAVYFGFRIGGPGPLNVLVLLAFGALGGAVWAGIAGVLRTHRGVPEVLTTLLMVTVAGQVVAYGLKKQSLLLAPAASRGNRNQVSEQLAADNRLPVLRVFGNEIPSATFLAVILAILVAFAMGRTVWGVRLHMLGRNPRIARRVGVSEQKYGLAALLVGGAFAGLAGAVMLTGGGFQFSNYRLVPGFSAGIGWTGLLVALVAREKVLAAVGAAFVFAALRNGSGFVNSTGVESRITEVVQGFLVLALLIPPAVMFLRDRRRSRAASAAGV
ncbi:MAG: ABC transporter permease [Actinomycetia bacterium]|nr:ABC transporter permease [Actinomycetes bacterium]MCP4958630.1 ABC transporter permease [Actinomycetes bacterium]